MQKTEDGKWRENLLKKLEKEREMTDWVVKLQRTARKGRFEQLKKKEDEEV